MTRHVIMQAAMDGAVIMSLLTAGLLAFGRVRKPTAGPKPQPASSPARPDRDGRSSTITNYRSWLPETAELGDHRSPVLPDFPPDYDPDDDQGADPGADWRTQSDVGISNIEISDSGISDVEIAREAGGPAAMDLTSSTDDEHSWPDFLALASDTEQAMAPGYAAAEPDDGRQPAKPPDGAEPPDVSRDNDQNDDGELDESGFSPAALRILGARPLRQRDEHDVPPQRYQVALGDDRIDVVLTEAPAVGQPSRPRAGNTWLAATPYLLWAPLPYDVPDDGLAFVCVGAGDEGCLFIDLGAAPGAVAISGDPDAAGRLAESIAHQLSARAPADQAIALLLVGRAIGEPHPAGVTSVATLRDLASVNLDSPPDSTDIVFCELRTSEDAFVLARHVRGSRRRIVPVVVGHLPGAAWSFSAHPSPRADGALPPLPSCLAGSPSP